MSPPQLSELEKFEVLFRSMPAALALLRGPDLVFEMANDAYQRLVGRTDLLGRPLLEALPEIRDQAFPAILAHVLESGEEAQLREVAVRLQPAGEPAPRTLYCDINYRRLNDEAGLGYGVLVFALDVSDRVRARQDVLLEREKLEAVFASNTAALAILRGPAGLYEKVNTSYSNLFSNRTLVGRTLVEALPELAAQKFPDLVREVFQSGETYRETEARAYLRRTDDGPLEERFFDQSYSRIDTSDGEPYGVLIQALDVTDRVRSRQALAEANDRFRLALESARMGTWELDVESGLVTWSSRTRELFGLPSRPQLPLAEAMANIHPDDHPIVSDAIERAIDPAGDGSYDIKYRIVRDGETQRWLALRGRAYFDVSQGERRLTSFRGTVLDETASVLAAEALRVSERKFRSMAELMPQIAWTADADGGIDFMNQRWRAFVGDVDPRLWGEAVHPDDLPRAQELWGKAVRTGEPYSAELRLREGATGKYRWFLSRATSQRDADGAVEKWFGTCTDIEAQKAELAARSEFMSIASHELKTPLTSLKLQTQSMRRNYEKGRPEAFSLQRVGDLVRNNEKQIGRLVRLVDDMLDFARIDAGRLSMDPEPSDLVPIAKEVFDHLREQLESAQITATFTAEEPVPVVVDRFRVEQVVTNLLTNALRYGPGKPVVVTVARRNGRALLTVADQGRGVPPELKEKIFLRFERGVSASEVSGLGLGLFISQEIVHAHGGRIWVESEPGRGSTFFVELPLSERNL